HVIAQLEGEHLEILDACRRGEEIADSLLLGQHVPPSDLLELVHFFEEITSRHSRKERDLLFPRIVRAFGSSVVDCSLRDHEEGVWWVRCLDQAAHAYSRGCNDARRRWALTFGLYASMLRSQIECEERSVFPLAKSAIGDDGWKELAVAFEMTDR